MVGPSQSSVCDQSQNSGRRKHTAVASVPFPWITNPHERNCDSSICMKTKAFEAGLTCRSVAGRQPRLLCVRRGCTLPEICKPALATPHPGLQTCTCWMSLFAFACYRLGHNDIYCQHAWRNTFYPRNEDIPTCVESMLSSVQHKFTIFVAAG